jgi:uncharacterized protein YecT (DUF1311 family)
MLQISRMIALCVLTLSLLAARAVSAQQKNECSEAQSQAEMNACASSQYRKADDELNAVYKQLISKYRSHAEFVQKLRLAQQSWLKFRDADVNCFFYQDDKTPSGSVSPMCRSLRLTALTVARTKQLKEMLNPEEGDVCAFTSPE